MSLESDAVTLAKKLVSEPFRMFNPEIVGLPCSDCDFADTTGKKRVEKKVVPIQACRNNKQRSSVQAVQYRRSCDESELIDPRNYDPSNPEIWTP